MTIPTDVEIQLNPAFEALFQSNILGLVLLDQDRKIVKSNNTALKLLECSLADILGKSGTELNIEFEERERNLFWKTAQEKGFATNVEAKLRSKSREISVSLSAEKLMLDLNEYWLISVTDITPIKIAQNERITNNQKLSNHLYNNPLGIVEYDTNLQVIEWSPRSEEIFKWRRDEIINKDITAFNLIYEEDLEKTNSTAEDLMTGKVNGNISYNRNYTKKGDIISCVWYNSVVKDEKGEVISIMSLVQDITTYDTLKQDLELLSNRFLLATNAGELGIFDWNIQKNKLIWNEYMYEMHELSFSKLVDGIQSWYQCILIDDATNLKLKFDECIREGNTNRITSSYRLATSDRYIEIDAAIILDESKTPISLIGVCIDRTESIKYEKLLNKTIIETQEEERQSIGRELHDNIIQLMIASLISLNHFTSSNQEIESISRAHHYTKKAIEETRRLSHQLIPFESQNNTLSKSIENLLRDLNIDNRFKITTKIYLNTIDSLNQELGMTIYRILQEQMNNILKYSKASSIEVCLEESNSEIKLLTKDDGIGFDKNAVSYGIGISNIIRRVEIFEGSYLLETETGYGCSYVVKFPLK